ncbi:hypothetical protein VFPFJ_09039 [Purpureocillium lilacinum]|uniref:Uncharacterized protein n=1 Tax=Purpureocillium lilacinum TaxID=33203 RepID=A0A179GZ18_PURLI|nr:hypothetical protein VFPFJ_09039 [Purpureocillium lilacinum]OAQ83236.1 hypothetical protein VFPFJ_09039 [Purpureocillium lilacinum]
MRAASPSRSQAHAHSRWLNSALWDPSREPFCARCEPRRVGKAQGRCRPGLARPVAQEARRRARTQAGGLAQSADGMGRLLQGATASFLLALLLVPGNAKAACDAVDGVALSAAAEGDGLGCRVGLSRVIFSPGWE